jgi:TolB-like protein/Tfp pilus assembly protein PilF
LTSASGHDQVIVVLPFTDLSPAKECAHLCDGIVEELVTALAKLPGVRVPSLVAISHLTKSSPAEMVGSLGSTFIIEGGVRRFDDRVRVLVRATRYPAGTVLWAQTFEASVQHVLALEERLLAGVFRACGHQSALSAVREHSGIAEAYDLYLLSRRYWNTRSIDGLQKSIAYASQALEQDSSYALAAAGLAIACATLASYTSAPPAPLMQRARAAALQALAMNDSLSEAHMALGFVQITFDWDWSAGYRSLARAIQLDPLNATAHQWISIYYVVKGLAEPAIAACQRADQLDPGSPIIKCHASWMLYFLGQPDAALKQVERAVEIDETFWRTHFNLGLCYARLGRDDESVRAMETAYKLNNHPTMMAALAACYASVGRSSQAAQLIERSQAQHDYVSAYWLAAACASLGRQNEALQWLWRAFDDREWYLVFAKLDPLLDPVRHTPEFQSLITAVGL